MRANLPTCKDLIHADLQMNPDQTRLDKACSPNTAPPHHPASGFASCSDAEDEGKYCLAAQVLPPTEQGLKIVGK